MEYKVGQEFQSHKKQNLFVRKAVCFPKNESQNKADHFFVNKTLKSGNIA